MSNDNPICYGCSIDTGKMVRYFMLKVGVLVPYGDNQIRKADQHQCPECGNIIITGFGIPFEFSKMIKSYSKDGILKNVID
jgi:hypothetical protein